MYVCYSGNTYIKVTSKALPKCYLMSQYLSLGKDKTKGFLDKNLFFLNKLFAFFNKLI